MKVAKVAFVLLFTTAAQASVVINEETFPDEAFRSLIASLPEGKDGILTDEEISNITYLSVISHDAFISDLKGIEYLTGLTMLECCYSIVKEIDLSANTALEIIRMEVLPTLETLNVSGLSSLKYLICQRISLHELDLSTCPALQYLYLSEENLTELDLSNNINLKELNCRSNKLTSLDLSGNMNLEKLDCSGNQLTSLVLPQSETLSEVMCFANHLFGESMDQLVASLPTVAKGDFYPYIELADVDEEGPQTEFNVCTTSQVEIAKSKNWTVYGRYHLLSGYWEEYAGSSTTGIHNATRQEQSVDSYSINGMVLSPSHSLKGIIIQKGRKVVVK